jgi:hypothetical protein
MNSRSLGAVALGSVLAVVFQAQAAEESQDVKAAATDAPRPATDKQFENNDAAMELGIKAMGSIVQQSHTRWIAKSKLAPGIECRIKTGTHRGVAMCYEGVVKTVDKDSVRIVAAQSCECRRYDVPLIFVGLSTTLQTGWCEEWKSEDGKEITIAKDEIARVSLLKAQ